MSNSKSSFSVVMTVYDNARELEENLSAFLQQVYEPGYEVIVVDESSTDNTDDVLKLHKNDYPQLYTTFLPKPDRNETRRRLAFTIGAKAAKKEWVILTDIREKPFSNNWLETLAENTDRTTELVLGYTSRKAIRLQQFEDFSQARKLVRKTERKKADGHKGRHLKYLRGQYDFLAVRREQIHDVLKFFDDRPGFWKLLQLRMGIFLQNLWQLPQTLKLKITEVTTE